MQEQRPNNAPDGTIQIDPEEGFGPHVSRAFLDLYGEQSVFVAASVDCLSLRFVRVLVRAEKLPKDFTPVQYGTQTMVDALENFLGVLAARGFENPSVFLMRSALGHDPPLEFQSLVAAHIGDDVLARWLQLFEKENYAGAYALLSSN